MMAVKGQKAGKVKKESGKGRNGKNQNWPGCTEEFVKRTEKRRKKNKQAKDSRKKNRGKK